MKERREKIIKNKDSMVNETHTKNQMSMKKEQSINHQSIDRNPRNFFSLKKIKNKKNSRNEFTESGRVEQISMVGDQTLPNNTVSLLRVSGVVLLGLGWGEKRRDGFVDGVKRVKILIVWLLFWVAGADFFGDICH
jgi:hypothetical protein